MTPAKGIGKYRCDTRVIPDIPLNIMYDSKNSFIYLFYLFKTYYPNYVLKTSPLLITLRLMLTLFAVIQVLR